VGGRDTEAIQFYTLYSHCIATSDIFVITVLDIFRETTAT